MNSANHVKCWASGNKKIDNLVQEIQLKILLFRSLTMFVIIGWISYSQFDDIK